MDHAEKKSGEGLAHPAASQTALPSASTVATATPLGFDNQTAQNALQQPHATASTHPLPPEASGAPAHGQHAASGDALPWPPGFAGELAKFIYFSSYLPVREVSIAAALGFLAGVCGRAYTISDKPTSLYIILVAKSAIGKDAMHDGIHKLIKLAAVPGSERFIQSSDFVSGPALHKALLREPGFLYLAGEFGRKLKRMAAPRDTPMQDLRTTMTDAWNKDYLSGKSYSKVEDSMLGVARPALSFLGETTPNTFYESLTQDMLADGFMSRFLVIEYQGDRPDTNHARSVELEPEELPRLQEILMRAMAYQNLLNCPDPTVVQYQNLDAEEKLAHFELECADAIRAAGNDESQRMMWNRGHIKALQIAALLAIADDPANPKIHLGHATWGITLVRKDIAVFKSRLLGGDIGAGDHARESKLFSLIRKYFTEPVGKGYMVPAGMKEAGIIPRRYLQMSTSKTASFVNHIGGAPGALKITLNTLVENGALMLVPKDKMPPAWGAQGTCYQATDKAFVES
jgi:hypothetical protein